MNLFQYQRCPFKAACDATMKASDRARVCQCRGGSGPADPRVAWALTDADKAILRAMRVAAE